MGSIGPDYNTLDLNSLLLLFLLVLIVEFKTIRSSFIACLFAALAYFHGALYPKIWFAMLQPETFSDPRLLMRASSQFLLLLFLTWLLWRRKTVLWRGIAFCGWCLLAVAIFFSVFIVYGRLEGFFHWVQIIEFILLALLLNAPPWFVIYALLRLGYRPFPKHSASETLKP